MRLLARLKALVTGSGRRAGDEGVDARMRKAEARGRRLGDAGQYQPPDRSHELQRNWMGF